MPKNGPKESNTQRELHPLGGVGMGAILGGFVGSVYYDLGMNYLDEVAQDPSRLRDLAVPVTMTVLAGIMALVGRDDVYARKGYVGAGVGFGLAIEYLVHDRKTEAVIAGILGIGMMAFTKLGTGFLKN